jgi:peptidoglycan hydrolase-like protein with peptidoglycan-binding domain
MPKTPFLLNAKSIGLYVVLALLPVTLFSSNMRADGSERSADTPPADNVPPPTRTADIASAATPPEAKAVVEARPKVQPAEPRPAKARKGSDLVFEIEGRLSALGYWTGPIDGVWDSASTSAVMAFQKVEGLRRSGKLSAGDLAVLRVAQRPVPLETGPAHVEVDLAKQVLYFVDDSGMVSHVLPVSTGNGKSYTVKGVRDIAYTPRGRCTVYRKIAGERVAPLGSIFYPNYLVGGIAIHGSSSIPAVPASHGCVRIPMWACKAVSGMTPVGTVVLVHDAGSFSNDASWLKQVARNAPSNYNESMAFAR